MFKHTKVLRRNRVTFSVQRVPALRIHSPVTTTEEILMDIHSLRYINGDVSS